MPVGSAELLCGDEARAWLGEGLELAGVGDRVSERLGKGSYPDHLLEIAARGGGIRPLLRDVLPNLSLIHISEPTRPY